MTNIALTTEQCADLLNEVYFELACRRVSRYHSAMHCKDVRAALSQAMEALKEAYGALEALQTHIKAEEEDERKLEATTTRRPAN